MGADGLNLAQDLDGFVLRPRDLVARAVQRARVRAQTGPGYDIKIYEFATGRIRQITFGEGSNESPASRRTAATSHSRRRDAGKVQIFTIGRDGKDLRQVTRIGNNFTPDWSR